MTLRFGTEVKQVALILVMASTVPVLGTKKRTSLAMDLL